MTQLSRSLHTTALSFTLFCTSIFAAESLVESSIREYVNAAHSCNLERYQKACEQLIATVKASSPDDALACSKIAHEIAPRVRHNAASFSYSAGPFSLLNTYLHTISKRGDSKECLALSMAANAEALACTLTILSFPLYVIYKSEYNPDIHSDVHINSMKAIHMAFAGTLLLSLVNVLQWIALYKNNTADKEKNAFDDAYTVLIKQLEILIPRSARRA